MGNSHITNMVSNGEKKTMLDKTTVKKKTCGQVRLLTWECLMMVVNLNFGKACLRK